MNNPNLILKIDDKRICAYCGKTVLPDKYKTYRCSCPDAQLAYSLIDKAIDMEIEANILRTQIPKPRFGLKTVCAPIEFSTTSEDDAPDPCV